MDELMIKCNKAGGKYEIQARNAGFYHFRSEQILVNLKDAQHPITRYRIFPVRLVDYQKYFSPKLSVDQQIGYQKAMGFTTLELIHDPNLVTKEQIETVLKITAPEVKASKELQKNKFKYSKRPLTPKEQESYDALK
jgi:hypothetical protein